MQSFATTPLPALRHGLIARIIEPGWVQLSDPMDYAEQDINLELEFSALLEGFDGEITPEELLEGAETAGIPCTLTELLDLVVMLDDGYFLETPQFFKRQAEVDDAYNALRVRPMALADLCYPSDPAEFHRQLDTWLAWDTEPHNTAPPPAIIIPHIDPLVGWKSYARAWNTLRETDADTFVIFGVPHTTTYDRFMICQQDFAVPGGVVKTDREFIKRLRRKLPYEITHNQIAHRDEHSIEVQAIFLHHLFPDRDIRIVPILHGALWEYVESGSGSPDEDEAVQDFYNTIRQVASDLKRKVCWIASADLCHIGHQFGDNKTGRQMLKQIAKFDQSVIEQTLLADASGFISKVAAVQNQYRICGVAPIYATLQISNATKGELLRYDQWENKLGKSAVTYASVGLW